MHMIIQKILGLQLDLETQKVFGEMTFYKLELTHIEMQEITMF